MFTVLIKHCYFIFTSLGKCYQALHQNTRAFSLHIFLIFELAISCEFITTWLVFEERVEKSCWTYRKGCCEFHCRHMLHSICLLSQYSLRPGSHMTQIVFHFGFLFKLKCSYLLRLRSQAAPRAFLTRLV